MSAGPRIPRFFVAFVDGQFCPFRFPSGFYFLTDRIFRHSRSVRIVRVLQQLLTFVGLTLIGVACCTTAFAQDLLGTPSADIGPPGATTQAVAPTLTAADNANLEGCQVIARVDDQVVLACEVLWRVNLLLEEYQRKAPAGQRVPQDKIDDTRKQLMQREVASMVDRKLLFNQFRRAVPQENMPRIEENLRAPFEQHELPALMKQVNVDNQRDLEIELARLGSSLADVRRSFNERIMASEWIRSKVKVNEDVGPDEMIEYYRGHLADYDFPSQARWEELMVRKDRFKDAGAAYAEIAELGNNVWQTGTQKPVRGAAFAEIAKAKSDGFTAKDGGVRDWTTKGALQCKAIDDALFTLQVGQMSPIIDSGPAFHIIRVLERKEAGRKAFTDVQADIRDRLKEKRYQKEASTYLTTLRQDARVWTVFTGNVSAEVLLGRKPDETQQR
jgi:PPIC-type PPIASE domain